MRITRDTSVLIIIGIFLIRPSIAHAELYGQADLSYQKYDTNTSDNSESKSTFTQGYTIGGAKILTNAISIRGDVRYTIIDDVDSERKENAFPTVTFDYSPPSLYNFSFGYTRTEVAPSDGVRLSTSNLNASFSIPTETGPSLSLHFNRSATQDYEEIHKIDNVNSRYGLNTGYGFMFREVGTNLNYSFTHQVTEDNAGETKGETPTHIVTADLTGAFLDKIINTHLSVGYSLSTVTATSLGAESRFEQSVSGLRGLFSNDATPADGLLSERIELTDKSTQTPVSGVGSNFIDLKDASNNIGFQLPFAQSVHRIDLYIKTAALSISAAVYGWKVYTSDDGIAWTEVAINPASYVPSNRSLVPRFEFTFPGVNGEITSQYFKVVNLSPSAGTDSVNVTEIDAQVYLLSKPEQTLSYDLTRDFMGFNVTSAPCPGLSLGYNFNYDHSRQSLYNSDSRSINNGLNLNYIILDQYLTFSSSYSKANNKSSQEITGLTSAASESGTDSYTLSFSSNPLPTLRANLSYSFFENMINGAKTAKNNTIGSNVSVNLYRGIDAGAGVSVGATEEFNKGSKTDTVGRYVNINLQPRSDLNIALNGTDSTSETDLNGNKTTSTGKTLNASASYAPTRRLYLSANFFLEPTTSQDYAVTWLPTRTIQTSVRYGISQDYIQTGASFSWAPLARLNMLLGYNQSKSEGTTKSTAESVFAKASLRF